MEPFKNPTLSEIYAEIKQKLEERKAKQQINFRVFGEVVFRSPDRAQSGYEYNQIVSTREAIAGLEYLLSKLRHLFPQSQSFVGPEEQ